MHNYVLDEKLKPVFEDRPWWAFMGKYFGFPDCCIESFCNEKPSQPSPFDGTGYVPCSCCNQKMHDPVVVEQYKEKINLSRYHNYSFGYEDDFEDNPKFFTIMEDFYTKNKQFPYEEMLDRGAYQYLYKKFLHKDFSFLVHFEDKNTKQPLVIDMAKHMSGQNFYWIFNDFLEDPTNIANKTMILKELKMQHTHTVSIKDTNISIDNYYKEVQALLVESFNFFTTNIMTKPKKNTKKSAI